MFVKSMDEKISTKENLPGNTFIDLFQELQDSLEQRIENIILSLEYRDMPVHHIHYTGHLSEFKLYKSFLE